MKSVVSMIAVAVLAAVLCQGCQEKFTRANYDMVFTGQPTGEVKQMLGRPYATFNDEWVYIHEGPFYKANIVFTDGRVSGKRWSDEKGIEEHPAGAAGRKGAVTQEVLTVP